MLFEQTPGDHQPLNLAGAFVDLACLGIAHHAFDRVFFHIPMPTQNLYGLGGDLHGQRADRFGLGSGDAGQKIVGAIFVHQKADRAPIEAKNRYLTLQTGVKRMKHKAIAAQGHDNVRLIRLDRIILGGQLVARRFGLR